MRYLDTNSLDLAMKNSIFRFGLLLLACCGTTSLSLANGEQPNEQKTAKIIIFRPNNFTNWSSNFSIFANQERICKLSNNRFVSYEVAPGAVSLKSRVSFGISETKDLDLNVEAGKTYYVRCDLLSQVFALTLDMTPISDDIAKKYLDMYNVKPDACMKKKE